MLGAVDARSFHTKVMRIWRSITATHFMEDDKHLLDQEALNKFSLHAPSTMIIMQRVNLFIRVVIKGSPDLKRSLYAAKKSKKSLLKAAEADFEWLQNIHADFAALENFHSWILAVAQKSKIVEISCQGCMC